MRKNMNIVKIIGAIFFVFGLTDFAGSFLDFDLWSKIGVQLPDIVWRYSAYIELALGGFLFSMGSKKDDQAESES